MRESSRDRQRPWRSRWAAIGAAVAVTLGAGGLVAVDAATGEASSFVAVTPTRILDTRSDVGLAGPFASGVSQKLQVTGSVSTQPPGGAAPVAAVVVPVGALSVVFNVTVIRPSTGGFLSVRPGDASGVPATSNINWAANGPAIANAVTVQLPVAGDVDIFVSGTVGEVLVDVAGYNIAASGGASGPAGADGADGAPGTAGANGLPGQDGAAGQNGAAGQDGAAGNGGADGSQGPAGVDAESPARVLWVADDGTGDYSKLSEALAAIGTTLDAATALKPYVIKIAPGTYTETSTVTLKNNVDVEGSGQGVTTITCACGSGVTSSSATVSAGAITAEIRHLTIDNTGPNDFSLGMYTAGVTNGSVSMNNVTATATGGTNQNYGVLNGSSSPSMNNVTATATGGTNNYGVYNVSSSSPSMNNVTATATGGTSSSGVQNSTSSPSMNNVTATATGGTNNSGVYNSSSSSPSMNNVTATATGGTFSVGVQNVSSSSPSMNNVTATATGGTTSRGVQNNSSSSPSIRNSALTGSTNSIFNFGTAPSAPSAKVADTVLDGAVEGAGFTCSSVSTAVGVALGPDCLADRVVTVADAGGDYTSLSAALAAIGTTLPAATALKPYVIKIAPGTYTETSTVTLKNNVDVEGSGQGVTTITCACGKADFSSSSATVSAGAITAEIRHLTIDNTGPNDFSLGVYTTDVSNGSFSMNNVTATATGGTNENFGVYNFSSSPSMNNVTATATGGTLNVGVYNSSSSSPSMNNVTATATGGTSNYGVINVSSSSPSMNNVTATATGGTSQNYGVFNSSSSPSMNNVTATATGGTFSVGVQNTSSSSPSMNNVTATATGGTFSRGVQNNSSSSPSIRNSALTGSTNSIFNFGTAPSAKVADTVLDGAVEGAGFTCSSVSTSVGVALGPDCLADRVVTVADAGGDYTSLSAALAAIGTTLPAATALKPYVIKIAPGTYTETSTVTLKNNVDVEGSGQSVTKLTCACGSADFPGAAVTAGSITAELRQITITNTGGSTYATGLYTNGVSDGTLTLSDVSAAAAGSTNNIGIRNQASSPAMTNIVATATGGSSSQGVSNDSSSSPSMNNVTATATGGTFSVGVQNTSSSSPSMNNVTATATGGTDSRGVANVSSSSPSMNNVTATATGGTNNYGVTNDSSSPTIRNSALTGSTSSIVNFGTAPSAKVADTVLDGAVSGSGFACVGVYTTAFTTLGVECEVV